MDKPFTKETSFLDNIFFKGDNAFSKIRKFRSSNNATVLLRLPCAYYDRIFPKNRRKRERIRSSLKFPV